MSGYHNYSMSNNAVDAYNQGEKPRSKWTKTEIIEAVTDYDGSQWGEATLKKCLTSTLRLFFLEKSSWHHTSMLYNETNFYSIDEGAIIDHNVEKLLALDHVEREEKKLANKREKADHSPVRKGLITFDQWEGSRKYGRFVRYDSVPCLVVGDWAYTEANGKKNLLGSHVISFEECTDPLDAEYNNIQLPKKYTK